MERPARSAEARTAAAALLRAFVEDIKASGAVADLIVGGRGWVGVRIDRRPDWRTIVTLVADAYRLVAPPRLWAAVASARSAPPATRRARCE